MKRFLTACAVAALALTASSAVPVADHSAALAAAETGDLRIYWIDVEGGASTLFVSPTGESLLFDTGNPGNGDRDAKRIFATAQKAGLTKIDHVVISHWHGDHVGGLEALSKMIPLGKFYDHGDGVEAVDKARHDAYVTLAGANRKMLKAGDTIGVGAIQFRVVVSEGPVIANPINGGGPNPLCASAPQMNPAPPENIRMVGLAVTYNNFKFASLGDLDWTREMEMACPVNKLGHINLYTINRHGGLDDSGNPALLGAIKPQVIVLNNGPRKGLGQTVKDAKPTNVNFTPYETNSYLRLAKNPGIEGVWQEHLSMIDKDAAHNTAPDMIANLDEGAADQGYGISAVVGKDGKFTITNARNGFSKTYTAH
ncbi:MAG TPA: MBL fold metallo-hydrolase [Micropepsaceae bacterium]|nr:MBL fold metallo-hydrolase [Micropepsaceae bacterium]